MKEKKPNQLQKLEIDSIKKIELFIASLPDGRSKEKADAERVLKVHKTILHKLGWRPVVEDKVIKKPRLNVFKKRLLTPGEKKARVEASKIDNSKAPKRAFKKNEGKKKIIKKIDNSGAKNRLKAKDKSIVATPEAKKGKKFGGRLSKERKLKIVEMYDGGETVADISEFLWISEKAISKLLEIKPKANKTKPVVLADNQKEGIEGFIDEVKESKKE